MKKKLGIILPCFNESEIIDKSITKLLSVISDLKDYKSTIVLIDDGSSDATWSKISQACSKNEKSITGVKLIQNVGKDKCLIEGIKSFKFDIYITMDIDGEHPFEGIKDLINRYEKGSNLVLGVRENFNDSFFIKQLKKFYYFIFKAINYKKYQSSDFRLFSHRVKEMTISHFSHLNYYKPIFDYINLDEEYYFYNSKKNTDKKKSKFNLISLVNYAFTNLTFYNVKFLNISIMISILICFVYFINIILTSIGINETFIGLLNKLSLLLTFFMLLIFTIYLKNIYEILLSNNRSKIVEIINKNNAE